MSKETIGLVAVAALMFTSIAGADSLLPDLDLSTATMECPPGAVLFVGYDRSGYSFENAVMIGGEIVDATITLNLLDPNGDPVYGYPAEDLWLETTAGGLIPCLNGTHADAATDFNGQTQWREPLNAGGSALDEGVHVMVAGAPLTQPPLDLGFLSGDVNGDGIFNLEDMTLFTGPYYYGYQDIADFHHDGVMNLTDLTLLAGAYLYHNVCQ